MGKGLKVEGSSDGPTVVGGVVGETGGRRQDGLVTRLCRTDDGKSPNTFTVLILTYSTCAVDLFQKNEHACMHGEEISLHTLLYTEIQIEGGNVGVNEHVNASTGVS